MNFDNMTYADEIALNAELSDRENGRAKFFLLIVTLRRTINNVGTILSVLALFQACLLGLVLWRVW